MTLIRKKSTDLMQFLKLFGAYDRKAHARLQTY